MSTWPAILFWAAIATGLVVAWWMWRLAVAMRGTTDDEGGR